MKCQIKISKHAFCYHHFGHSCGSSNCRICGRHFGISLGDKETDGSCKFTAGYEADFGALAGSSKLIRICSSSEWNSRSSMQQPARASVRSLYLVIDRILGEFIALGLVA